MTRPLRPADTQPSKTTQFVRDLFSLQFVVLAVLWCWHIPALLDVIRGGNGGWISYAIFAATTLVLLITGVQEFNTLRKARG